MDHNHDGLGGSGAGEPPTMMFDRDIVVLVADDDADIRAIVGEAIGTLGCTVVTAHDGTSAFERYTQLVPHLAILDFMMPGLSGQEVCVEIRRRGGSTYTAIMMLTARTELKDKVDSLDLGADDYLTKPFALGELLARVRALLRVVLLTRELRENYAKLEAMQERLIEQERKLVASQLGGTVSHRLGQPLAALLLNCHLLEVLPPNDPKFAEAVKAIRSDTTRMAELIERLKQVDSDKRDPYYKSTEILDIGTPPEKGRNC